MCRYLLPLFVLLSIPAAAQNRGVLVGEDGGTVPEGELRTAVRATSRFQPDGSHLYRVPHVQIDFGISSWAEIGLEVDLRWIDGEGSFPSSGIGAGDPGWRLKLVPYRDDGWSMGGALYFKMPSADDGKGLGTDHADGRLSLFATRAFDEGEFGITVGLVAQDVSAKVSEDELFFLWSVWLRYEFAPSWSLYAEIHGTEGEAENINVQEGMVGDDWISGRLAIQTSWKGWSIGLAGEIGITGAAPEARFLFEVSRKWGILDPAEEEETDSSEKAIQFLDPFPTRSAEPIASGLYALFLETQIERQHNGSYIGTLPRIGSTFALGKSADLRWWASYRSRQESLGSGPTLDALGDLFVEVRWVPGRWEVFQLGLLLGGKLPLSSRHLGVSSGVIDVYAKLLASMRFDKFAAHANVGFAINDHPTRGRQVDSLLLGMVVEYSIHPRWLLSASLDGSFSSLNVRDITEGWAGARRASLRGSVQTWWPGSDTFAISASGAWGIGFRSPDFEASLGFALWLR